MKLPLACFRLARPPRGGGETVSTATRKVDRKRSLVKVLSDLPQCFVPNKSSSLFDILWFAIDYCDNAIEMLGVRM